MDWSFGKNRMVSALERLLEPERTVVYYCCCIRKKQPNI